MPPAGAANAYKTDPDWIHKYHPLIIVLTTYPQIISQPYQDVKPNLSARIWFRFS